MEKRTQYFKDFSRNENYEPFSVPQVCQHDTILVTLRNTLPSSGVSLHWHGLPTQPFMDGATALTRPLVAPQQEFQFKLEAKRPGTHFWHSAAGNYWSKQFHCLLLVGLWQKHVSCPNELIIVDIGYDWYLYLSLLKFLRKLNNILCL